MSKNLSNRILIAFLLMPIVFFSIYEGNIFFKTILICTFVLGVYEIFKLKIFFTKICLIFLLLLFLFTVFHIRISNDGIKNLYYIIVLTWLSDIGGYIFGKILGGKKINIISPNKTYSGFLGSLIFSQFSLILVFYYNIFPNFNLTFKLLITSFLCIVVIMGDLFFSYIKRLNKIKDYSNFFPGHGGLFDRVDGLIFAVIIFYMYI